MSDRRDDKAAADALKDGDEMVVTLAVGFNGSSVVVEAPGAFRVWAEEVGGDDVYFEETHGLSAGGVYQCRIRFHAPKDDDEYDGGWFQTMAYQGEGGEWIDLDDDDTTETTR